MLKLLNSTVRDSGFDATTLPQYLNHLHFFSIVSIFATHFQFFLVFYDFYNSSSSPTETLENT